METSLAETNLDRPSGWKRVFSWLPVAVVVASLAMAALLVAYLQVGRDILRPTDPNAARRYSQAIAMPRYLGVGESVEIVIRYPGSREAEAAAKFIVENCDHLGWTKFERLTGRHVPVLPEDDYPLGLIRKCLIDTFERRGVAEF